MRAILHVDQGGDLLILAGFCGLLGCLLNDILRMDEDRIDASDILGKSPGANLEGLEELKSKILAMLLPFYSVAQVGISKGNVNIAMLLKLCCHNSCLYSRGCFIEL
jgi:hypothetical protein